MNPQLVDTLLLVLICGAGDRIIGWGEWGRTKPLIVVLLALAGVGYLMGLPLAAIGTLPVAFAVWRTPGWHTLGGSINPAPSQALGTFARHMLAVGFVVPAFLAGVSPLVALGFVTAFAAVATALAVYNYFKRAHTNQTVETVRGMLLGLALAMVFVFFRR